MHIEKCLILLSLSGLNAVAETAMPSIIQMPILHSASTAALLPTEAAVEDKATEKLRALVKRIRSAEAPRGGPDSEKLLIADKSGCTWVRTGNKGGDKPTEDYQLFMAKMFVKHMCNLVSPIAIKAIPAAPYDAFYPSIKDDPKKSDEENKNEHVNKRLLKAESYDPKTEKSVYTEYKMDESSLENLIPLFAMMYSDGQREVSGIPTKSYRPTYEVDDTMGKDGILHQWNIGQGLFHVASNTLNFTSKINHPELTRIYSEYVTKLYALMHGPQADAAKKQKFDQMCMASSFDKAYLDSVGQKEHHNKISSQKTDTDSSGVDVAYRTINTFLSAKTDTSAPSDLPPDCVKQARDFMDKVSQNVSDALDQVPEYAAYLDKNQSYKGMINNLAKLHREIVTLEGAIKASEIDATLAERTALRQKRYVSHVKDLLKENNDTFDKIQSQVKANNDFFYKRETYRAQYANNIDTINKLIALQKAELTRITDVKLKAAKVDLENIKQEIVDHEPKRPIPTDLATERLISPTSYREAEFNWKFERKRLLETQTEREADIAKVLKEAQNQETTIKESQNALQIATQAQAAYYEREKNYYTERIEIREHHHVVSKLKKIYDQKLADSEAQLEQFQKQAKVLRDEHAAKVAEREKVVQKNQVATDTINNTRREAASMAFFSLDNTDYSLSKDGILGNREHTAKCFNALQRYCPAFSVDYHSVASRVNNIQFGPLSHSPKGLTPSCANMFQEIYAEKDQYCQMDQVSIVPPAQTP